MTASLLRGAVAQALVLKSAPDPHEAAWKAAGEAMQPGPATITLRDQAQINLPEGYGFIPPKEGAALMSVMGNQTDDNFLGLIFPQTEAEWFVKWHMGWVSWDDALSGGHISVAGPRPLAQAFPTWNKLSRFAGIRPEPSRV